MCVGGGGGVWGGEGDVSVRESIAVFNSLMPEQSIEQKIFP